MRSLISSEEVNTARQKEFDYLKGIFLVFIYLIHAFQATFSDESRLVSCIYIFATMTGAGMFIFIMGFGTAYSRRNKSADLAFSGLRMVVYQYLNNLLYIASLFLPYLFVMNRLDDTGADNFRLSVWVYFQYVNIFFITGIIYLVLALLKKLKCDIRLYPVIGIAVALLAPFIYGRPVNIPVVGYLVTLLIGEAKFVSFTPLYFLAYALTGAAAGRLYRRIKDKRGFYLRIIPVCAVIVAVWWTAVLVKHGNDFDLLRQDISHGYSHPDIFRVIATVAHILLFAGVVYFICCWRDKEKQGNGTESRIGGQILYYSSHISKYYAWHVTTYFVAFGFHGYVGFKPWQCWLLMLLSMIVTEGIVRGINHLQERWKPGDDLRNIIFYAAPYAVMMFMMLFRIYQLNHDREFFSPQQFETVVWWEFVIMIAVAQILFLRNKRMVEEKAGEQALMDTAREIQSGMVPREKEYSEGRFRISAFAQPARAVGGDFYDIIPLGDGKAGIVLGDVSGKGIPAALFMSMIKTMIRDRLLSGMSPEEALNQVNDAACAENPKGMFATVFAGVIDTGDGSLVFANAGHNPPLRTGRETEYIKTETGCALGLFEDAGIIREEAVVRPGESLLLYTDGATEAINSVKKPYGEQRLLEVCKKASDNYARLVADDVIEYFRGLEQFDDLTLMSISSAKEEQD